MKLILALIGDELMNSMIVDTNLHSLNQFIYDHGLSDEVTLEQVIMIGDGIQELKALLTHLNNESFQGVLITSGGLGPTKDDYTKDALVDFFEANLEVDENILSRLIEKFEKKNRNYDQRLFDYHLKSKHLQLIDNPLGMAPLLNIHDQSKACFEIFALPGVPKEFKAALSEVFSRSLNYQPKDVPVSSSSSNSSKSTSGSREVYRLKGISEAQFFHTDHPGLWEQLEKSAKVSSLPKRVELHIVLNNIKRDANFLQQEMILANSKYFWHQGGESLEQIVYDLLVKRGETISFGESCTGGLLGDSLTSVPGASQVFLASFVTYSNEIKQSTLGVRADTLQRFGAVSTQVSDEMACGVLAASGADWALATSGMASAARDKSAKKSGTLCLSIAHKKHGILYSQQNFFDPNIPRVEMKQDFKDLSFIELALLLKKN